MKPITFSCKETLDLTPEEIAQQILDVNRWLDFKGFGPLPGIGLRSSRSERPTSSALESESPTRTARSTSRRLSSGSPTIGCNST